MNDRKLIETVGKFLCDLINIPSISGREEEVIYFCAKAFKGYADSVGLVPYPPLLEKNQYFSSVLPPEESLNKKNLVIRIKGETSDPPIIINVHTDVVPPSSDMDQFNPKIEGYNVFGRGACDDKGSLAALYLMLLMLREKNLIPRRDTILHLVSEEETGGNGTLALLQEKTGGAAVINMEPTDLRIGLGHRGAVWFRVRLFGTASHSGSADRRENALLYACEAVKIITKVHKRLIEQMVIEDPFKIHKNPTPLTFGRLESGKWPSMVPDKALLEGVFGFLPPLTCEKVKGKIVKSINNSFRTGGKILPEIEFPFNNEPYLIDSRNIIVEKMIKAVKKNGIEPGFTTLNGCADLWKYHHKEGIPGILFGPGKLSFAHSKNEQIDLRDITKAAKILLDFIASY